MSTPVFRLRFILPAVIVVASFFSAAFGQRATRWDMWIDWPHTNYVTQAMIEFAELVEQRTDGQLLIQVHPGGALGYQGPEVLGAVRSGAIPIAEVLIPNMEGYDAIFELPLLPVPTSYEESQALYEIAEPFYADALVQHGVIPLAPMSFGTVGLYTQNELESPEDLEQLTVRTASAGATTFAEESGMRALTIPWGEVHTALSTGLANSVMTSSLSGVDGSFWEVTSYFYNELFPTSIERDLLIVNKNAFDRLPEDVQQVLVQTASEIADQVREQSLQQELDALATLEENGIEIIQRDQAPDWLLEAVQGGADKVVDEWVAEVGERGEEIVTSFRNR